MNIISYNFFVKRKKNRFNFVVAIIVVFLSIIGFSLYLIYNSTRTKASYQECQYCSQSNCCGSVCSSSQQCKGDKTYGCSCETSTKPTPTRSPSNQPKKTPTPKKPTKTPTPKYKPTSTPRPPTSYQPTPTRVPTRVSTPTPISTIHIPQ